MSWRFMMLPFHTGAVVPLGMSAQIASEAKYGYQIRRLFIAEHPKEWLVHSLRIVEQPLWNKDVDIPGGYFSTSSLWSPFADAFVKRGQSVVLLISYVGRLKKGRAFYGSIVGHTKYRARRKALRAGT